MDICISQSSRLLPSEKEELRVNSGLPGLESAVQPHYSKLNPDLHLACNLTGYSETLKRNHVRLASASKKTVGHTLTDPQIQASSTLVEQELQPLSNSTCHLAAGPTSVAELARDSAHPAQHIDVTCQLPVQTSEPIISMGSVCLHDHLEEESPTPTTIFQARAAEDTTTSASIIHSSAASVLSASGTLVPPPSLPLPRNTANDGTRPISTTRRYSLSRTTTFLPTLASNRSGHLDYLAPDPDLDLFKARVKELCSHMEHMEKLNEQALDMLTDQDQCLTLFAKLHQPRQKEEAITTLVAAASEWECLQHSRLSTAQTFTDLAAETWPDLYRSDTQHQWILTPKQAKQRNKMATQLKGIVVAFWGMLDRHQECVQVVSDVYQDSDMVEQEDSVRVLRSRHLDNLLACSLCPSEAKQLESTLKTGHDKMAVITEQLHGVLLGLVILIGEIGEAKLQKHSEMKGTRAIGVPLDDSGDGGDRKPETLGSRLVRLGQNKKQMIKNILSW
ncbi:hypothetical protein BG004_004062 [Podila humilis]|nr:hypothetical protein BG004_004062 [Podila humilis]